MNLREAKSVLATTYDGGRPCRFGHGTVRYVSSRSCVVCLAERGRGLKRVRDPEERRRANHKYYAKPDKMAAQVARTRDDRRKKPDVTRLQGRKDQAKRRARKKAIGGEFTGEEVRQLGERQKWKCANQACNVNIRDRFHADHVMPLAKGGANYIRNIQLLCPPCNLKKRDKHPIQWAQMNGLLL